jgi:UDP-N-acetylmuramate--L-alanine ligase/UDP-N-acetylenolpyruvoylglucosamine reductase
MIAGIPERVHLVGVGGMHLSAIARILIDQGHSVSGSDMRLSPLTEELARLGVSVREGHSAENISGAELVVTTSAAREDNPELVAARELGTRVMKRHEFVAKLLEDKRSICVAGTHGKTTTTGLIASMLVRAGRAPTYLVGGEVRELRTNAASGQGEEIVVEADEFDRAFLAYSPDLAVVLNVEPDHLDIYGSFEGYAAAFAQFMSQVKPNGLLVACTDSTKVRDLVASANIASRIQTYALSNDADWHVKDIRATPDGGHTFDVLHGGEEETFELQLPGQFNIANALSAIVVGRALGIPNDVIRETLALYSGTSRRFELVGEAADVTVMDDYAHHPTEIAVNVAAARERFAGRRIIACFQPHTYSRTQYLLEEFRTCFRGLDELLVLATYAAREPESAGVDARGLVDAIEAPSARFVADFDEAAQVALELLEPGDVFFTIGAGDVDTVAPLVLQGLKSRMSRTSGSHSGHAEPRLVEALEKVALVRTNEPLSRHTTFGIGGPADIYVVANNADELARIVIACREFDLPAFVLGSGSNILIGDGGIRGVVIENNAKALIGPEPGEAGAVRFRAESGASFAGVARSLARRGYAGLEWASGIPGTLGGAVVYNAGAYGGSLSDVLQSVSLINGTGSTKELPASELGLQYRGSVFTRGSFDNRVVLTADFVVWPGDTQKLMERVQDLDTRRLAAQPRGRNAGSIFKNPPDHPAWRLIEQVGLRGHRIGDAMISDKHCNFFVNVGQARAEDVKALIYLARSRISERFGIELELEVGLVGEGFNG